MEIVWRQIIISLSRCFTIPDAKYESIHIIDIFNVSGKWILLIALRMVIRLRIFTPMFYEDNFKNGASVEICFTDYKLEPVV